MRTAAFNAALLLDRMAAIIPPCLYGLGVFLLARKVLPVPTWLTPSLLIGLAGIAAAVCLAGEILSPRNRWFTPEYAAAWLDLRNRAGGGILAGGTDAPAPAVLPAASIRYLMTRVLWPMVFVLAASLVPAAAPAEEASAAGLERKMSAFERELDASWQAGALPEPEAESLRAQLRRLREWAARDPESAAEAIAALPGRLEEARIRRLEAVADALEKTAAMKNAWSAAESDAFAGGWTTGEASEALRRSLEALTRAEGGGEQRSENLKRAMRELERGNEAGEAAGGGSAMPAASAMAEEQLDSLLHAMRAYGDAVYGADGAFPGSGGRSPGREGALARLEAAGAELGKASDAIIEMGASGTGDVGRGHGDAPLTFGEPSRKDGLEADYRPLASGLGAEMGVLLRREREIPDERLPPEEFRSSRRRSFDLPEWVTAGQGGMNMGPGREQAVARYFEELSSQ